MKRRLKKSVVYVLYGIAFVLMLGGLFFIDNISNNSVSSENEQNKFVSQDIINDVKDIPVNATEDSKVIIKRPYLTENVKIVKDYYNISDDEESQKNSLLYYENTYMQSSGVSYGGDKEFDVLAILDGKVIEVKEDDVLGNVITIEHDNGVVSSYQSVTDIKVKALDTVKQGDVIAKSSTSNISTDLGNHLYFELMINGSNVDPEEYFGKQLDEV